MAFEKKESRRRFRRTKKILRNQKNILRKLMEKTAFRQ